MLVLSVSYGASSFQVMMEAAAFFLGAVAVAVRGPSYLFIRTMRVAIAQSLKAASKRKLSKGSSYCH